MYRKLASRILKNIENKIRNYINLNKINNTNLVTIVE